MNNIEAKDLRIGNMLMFKDKVFTVAGVSSPQQVRLYDGMGADQWEFIDTLNPIPLSEEWLLKLGAKTLPHKNILNSHIIDLGRNRILSISVQVGNTYVWLNEVNPTEPTEITDLVCVFNQDYDGELYVHQLQNLYWCLCGKELIIETQNKQ